MNGYDESKEVVEKFVQEKKLKQKIVLMGGKVARELYFVEGFPTTFLIDTEGKIVDREVDFRPAMASAREKKIQDLLTKDGPKKEAPSSKP